MLRILQKTLSSTALNTESYTYTHWEAYLYKNEFLHKQSLMVPWGKYALEQVDFSVKTFGTFYMNTLYMGFDPYF